MRGWRAHTPQSRVPTRRYRFNNTRPNNATGSNAIPSLHLIRFIDDTSNYSANTRRRTNSFGKLNERLNHSTIHLCLMGNILTSFNVKLFPPTLEISSTVEIGARVAVIIDP